jgi:hypothetical protein
MKIDRSLGKVIVTKIGRLDTGNDPIRGPRPILLYEAIGFKDFCASCGRRFHEGDRYIPESDTARHCMVCLEVEDIDLCSECDGKGYILDVRAGAGVDLRRVDCSACDGHGYTSIKASRERVSDFSEDEAKALEEWLSDLNVIESFFHPVQRVSPEMIRRLIRSCASEVVR